MICLGLGKFWIIMSVNKMTTNPILTTKNHTEMKKLLEELESNKTPKWEQEALEKGKKFVK